MKSRLLPPLVLGLCIAGPFLAGKWWRHRSVARVVPAIAYADGTATAAGSTVASTGALSGASEASVKKMFSEAAPTKDLNQMLRLLRRGSRLTANGLIASGVARLDKAQVAGWIKQIDLLPSGDPVQESLRRALVERWAEVDMAGLMAEASKPPSNYGYGGNQANYWVVTNTAFRALAAKNPEEAWAKAGRMGQAGYSAKSAVLAELALTNPAAGLKIIANVKGGIDGGATRSFFQAWAGQDPAIAAASVDQIKNFRAREHALGAVASVWSQRDPAGALAWADGQGTVRDRNQVLQQVLVAQAETDPQAALDNLSERNLGASQKWAMSNILNAWANRDFDAALGFATSQTKFSDKLASLEGVTRAINNDESRASQLLELAGTLPGPMARQIYGMGIGTILNDQPEKVQEWIDRIKQPSIKEDIIKQTIGNARWSNTDRDMISKLFGQLQPSSQRPEDAQQIASAWAYEDSSKALAWAEKIESVESRKKAVAAAVGAMVQKNPQDAATYVAAMPPGDTRDAAIATLAGSWVDIDAKKAEAWAAGLKGEEQSKVLGALVNKVQNEDPEKAPQAYATFAASLSPEAAAKKENQTVARNVASSIAQDDPQKAISWMEGLPAGGARDQAIGGIAGTWIDYDPAAASEWITQLPTGEGRDMAAGQLATTVARDDPSAAFIWATSIADPAARRKSAEAVLETWKNNGGREAARAALEAGQFNDQDRAELLKKLD